jgi:hypothetical protein
MFLNKPDDRETLFDQRKGGDVSDFLQDAGALTTESRDIPTPFDCRDR